MTTSAKPAWAKRPDPSRKAAAAATTVEDPTDKLIRSQTERTTTPDGSQQPAAKASTKHISMNMDAGLHKRLKHHCVTHDTNVSELLSELADRFLSSQTG